MAEQGERGHVLWIMLALLGLLAELATGSLQLAARSGAQALAEAGRRGRDARADAIAAALEALPVPSAASPVAALPAWHPALPAGSLAMQGCGGIGAYAVACEAPLAGDLLSSANLAPGWHWQLLRLPDVASDDDGTDYTAFPLLRPQRWQLRVVVTGNDRRRSAWRYDYRQQAAP